MSNYKFAKNAFKQTQIIRPPKRRLSTFGDSKIEYNLVTDVPGLPDRAKLRIGEVTAERPAIITPQSLKDRFQGFGEQAQDLADWLASQYGDALRGLEYNFRNEPLVTRVELTTPDQLTQDLIKDFDREDAARKTILRGTDRLWEISIMKFIVEETLSSFSSNIRELNERGFFEGDRHEANRRDREIRHLLERAKEDRSQVRTLGAKLKEYGLFEKYQDEFFQLIK